MGKSYYPNAASIATTQADILSDGVPVEPGDFVLQKRYPMVAVTGIVTSDGKPIQMAVSIWTRVAARGPVLRRRMPTGASYNKHSSQTYPLRAYADGPTGGAIESERVEGLAVKNTTSVRLVIQFPKYRNAAQTSSMRRLPREALRNNRKRKCERY